MGSHAILRIENNDPVNMGVFEKAKRSLIDVHSCWPLREIEVARGILVNCMCALRGQRFRLIEKGSDLWRPPKFNGERAKKRARLFAQKSSLRFL